MNLGTTGVVFHDTAGGGWYCNDCKQYIHVDMIYSHKHREALPNDLRPGVVAEPMPSLAEQRQRLRGSE